MDEACGGDERLRKEVESLIASRENDGSFIDSPAHDAGQSDEARQILDELLALSQRRFLQGYLIAKVYAGLGDKNQAFVSLEKSFDDRYFLMTWLKGEPQFDSIRSDPRFIDLVRRIGLPE